MSPFSVHLLFSSGLEGTLHCGVLFHCWRLWELYLGVWRCKLLSWDIAGPFACEADFTEGPGKSINMRKAFPSNYFRRTLNPTSNFFSAMSWNGLGMNLYNSKSSQQQPVEAKKFTILCNDLSWLRPNFWGFFSFFPFFASQLVWPWDGFVRTFLVFCPGIPQFFPPHCFARTENPGSNGFSTGCHHPQSGIRNYSVVSVVRAAANVWGLYVDELPLISVAIRPLHSLWMRICGRCGKAWRSKDIDQANLSVSLRVSCALEEILTGTQKSLASCVDHYLEPFPNPVF